MYEATLNKLYREYSDLMGQSLDEESFKIIALKEYPQYELDILIWTIPKYLMI